MFVSCLCLCLFTYSCEGIPVGTLSDERENDVAGRGRGGGRRLRGRGGASSKRGGQDGALVVAVPVPKSHCAGKLLPSVEQELQDNVLRAGVFDVLRAAVRLRQHRCSGTFPAKGNGLTRGGDRGTVQCVSSSEHVYGHYRRPADRQDWDFVLVHPVLTVDMRGHFTRRFLQLFPANAYWSPNFWAGV